MPKRAGRTGVHCRRYRHPGGPSARPFKACRRGSAGQCPGHRLLALQPAAAHSGLSGTVATAELFGGGPQTCTRETPVPASGFRDDTVITGLTLPSTIRFAPNGDIFVSEKSGLIKRYTSLSDNNPDITANLQTEVYNYLDRGLLGMASTRSTRPGRTSTFCIHVTRRSAGRALWDPPKRRNDAAWCAQRARREYRRLRDSGRLIRLTVDSNGGDAPRDARRRLVRPVHEPQHRQGDVRRRRLPVRRRRRWRHFSASDLDYGQFGGTVIDPTPASPTHRATRAATRLAAWAA